MDAAAPNSPPPLNAEKMHTQHYLKAIYKDARRDTRKIWPLQNSAIKPLMEKKEDETQDHKSVHILQLQISVKCYQTPYKTQGASATFSSATLPPNFMHL